MGDKASASHLPLFNSSLHLDTSVSLFRPAVSLEGQDWTVSGNADKRLSTTVAVNASAPTTSAEFETAIAELPDFLTRSPVSVPEGWEGSVIHPKEFEGSLGRVMLVFNRPEEFIITTFSTVERRSELDSLLAAMALMDNPNADPANRIPLILPFPEDWPYTYGGVAPGGGFVYLHANGAASYVIDVPPARPLKPEAVDKEVEDFRNERPDAIIEVDGTDMVAFSYDTAQSFSPLYAFRRLGEETVAFYGQLSAGDEEALLRVLREARRKE